MNAYDQESPDWRTENLFHKGGKHKGKIKKPNYKIKIPTANVLDKEIRKIESIGARMKFLEELLEFIEIYKGIKDSIGSEAFPPEIQTIHWIINEIKKIRRLKTLIKYNNCNISDKKIEQLLFHFTDIKAIGLGESSDIRKYPHKEEFEMLYKAEAKSILSEEDFEYEMCGTIPY